MYEVFYAAAWIVGEFGDKSSDAEHALSVLLIERPIPGHILAVYVQNIVKLYSNLMVKDLQRTDIHQMRNKTNMLLNKLPMFISSGDIEVQERASSANVIIQMIKLSLVEDPEEIHLVKDLLNDSLGDIQYHKTHDISIDLLNLIKELSFLYAGELNPVAKIAQRKVLLPEGLDLDVWINSDRIKSSDSSGTENNEDNQNLFVKETENKFNINPTAEEIDKV